MRFSLPRWPWLVSSWETAKQYSPYQNGLEDAATFVYGLEDADIILYGLEDVAIFAYGNGIFEEL